MKAIRRPRKAPSVLVIVQNLPVPFDRRVWLECQALVDAGYRVAVICPKGKGDPSYEHLQGVDIYKYRPAPEANGMAGFLYEFGYSFAATLWLSVRAARRHGVHVIQACNPPDTFWALALLYRAFGVRFVYDQHDLCPELYRSRFSDGSPLVHRTLLALERMTYRTAHHVHRHERLLQTGGRESGITCRPRASLSYVPVRTPTSSSAGRWTWLTSAASTTSRSTSASWGHRMASTSSCGRRPT